MITTVRTEFIYEYRILPFFEYVCTWYGHIISQSMDQPGKVPNPARGQLNRENVIKPSFSWSYL